MKLTALNALVAAVEEGSLRGAARRIGIAQPALSKLVRELERELSASLLQRSTTGVVATVQGRVLYEHAHAAARELSQAVELIRQLGGQMVGSLSIAAVPLALMLLIPETLRTFGREFPGIQLHVREELYIAQLLNLRKRKADIALGPIPEELPAGEFHVETVMPITMVVVAGRDNPLAQSRSLKALTDARWVYTSVSGSTGYARLLFEKNGMVPPAPGALVNSTLGLLALIGQGDFVGLMPLQIAKHPAAAAFMKMVPIEEGPLELSIGVMARSDGMLKPAVRHFIAHVHRAALHPLGARG